MGMARRYPSNAERQRAYRGRKDALLGELEALKFELQEALARGRSGRLASHLPEEPREWVPELTRRLRECRLVRCRLESAAELEAKRRRERERRQERRMGKQ